MKATMPGTEKSKRLEPGEIVYLYYFVIVKFLNFTNFNYLEKEVLLKRIGLTILSIKL